MFEEGINLLMLLSSFQILGKLKRGSLLILARLCAGTWKSSAFLKLISGLRALFVIQHSLKFPGSKANLTGKFFNTRRFGGTWSILFFVFQFLIMRQCWRIESSTVNRHCTANKKKSRILILALKCYKFCPHHLVALV